MATTVDVLPPLSEHGVRRVVLRSAAAVVNLGACGADDTRRARVAAARAAADAGEPWLVHLEPDGGGSRCDVAWADGTLTLSLATAEVAAEATLQLLAPRTVALALLDALAQ
jgi:hypothetical protein